jgi:hypothetical protein
VWDDAKLVTKLIVEQVDENLGGDAQRGWPTQKMPMRSGGQ